MLGRLELALYWHELRYEESEPLYIEVSIDGGATWELIGTGVPNSGTFAWWVATPTTMSGRVRIANLSGDTSDVSDEVFTIAKAPVREPVNFLGAGCGAGGRASEWSAVIPCLLLVLALAFARRCECRSCD